MLLVVDVPPHVPHPKRERRHQTGGESPSSPASPGEFTRMRLARMVVAKRRLRVSVACVDDGRVAGPFDLRATRRHTLIPSSMSATVNRLTTGRELFGGKVVVGSQRLRSARTRSWMSYGRSMCASAASVGRVLSEDGRHEPVRLGINCRALKAFALFFRQHRRRLAAPTRRSRRSRAPASTTR